MGKLSIKGRAKREVRCDGMEISIKFYIHGKTSTEALRNIKKQSEKFLRLITAEGISLQDIHNGEVSVEQKFNEGEMTTRAMREVVMRLPFDMRTINYLTELIREQNFSVDFECDYHITDEKQLHDDLLKEAFADSRQKAEFIAETMGRNIIGIDNVEYDLYHRDGWWDCESERGIICECPQMLSNQIEAPLRKESETIDVVWLIE